MASTIVEEGKGGTTANLVSIPDKQPKPEPMPSYRLDSPNYADNEKTAEMAVTWIKSHGSSFEDQGAWQKAEDNMDSTDEMYRAAVNRTQLSSDESKNTEDTRSKVKSGTFYQDMNIITSGETAVMLDKDNQLPMIYEPLPDSGEYSVELGQMLADEHNAVLAYTMEKSNMRADLRKTLWSTNKYGNCAIEMQWDLRKAERWVKKATKYEEIEGADGNIVQKPVRFTKKKKMVTIADHPRLIVHDLRNVRFDAMIDDMQEQSCILLRTQKQLSDLWGAQIAGQYKNMDKVTTNQLYSEEGRIHALSDRQENADEINDADKPTTLFDLNYGWVRLPVNDDTGAWEPTKQISHWYEYVMVGALDKQPVLVRLAPLPYSSGKIPFNVVHALEDDKGALHMGYADLERSIIAQEMTAIDQATDNITARNQADWIMERGSVSTRDLTFTAGGNRIYQKKRGYADPHVVDVPDTTAFTLQYLQYLEDYRRKVVGINDPLAGQALGGRTSAAEAIAVFDQALKPALEAAKYKANQIFPFIAFWVSEMWKDFGNPDLVINLTGKSPVKQVKPADIFGDMRIRVTAIKQFQDGILRRKEEDNFLATVVPLAMSNGAMGVGELAAFLREVAKTREFDGAERFFAAKSNFDAKHVAKAENTNIAFHGVLDLPQEGEDHETHQAEHKPFLGSIVLLPEGDKPPDEYINNLKLHIQQTDTMIQNQAQQAQTQQPEVQAQLNQGAAPRTAGEAVGDELGGMENPPGLAT